MTYRWRAGGSPPRVEDGVISLSVAETFPRLFVLDGDGPAGVSDWSSCSAARNKKRRGAEPLPLWAESHNYLGGIDPFHCRRRPPQAGLPLPLLRLNQGRRPPHCGAAEKAAVGHASSRVFHMEIVP